MLYVLDSGSARFKAEQLARTVQARIEANKTSIGATASSGSTLYSREPNRKNAFFIGNLTWVSVYVSVVCMCVSLIDQFKGEYIMVVWLLFFSLGVGGRVLGIC